MRIKIMPIVFMTLAIISMAMLANQPVLAQGDINLADTECTQSEQDLGLCFNVYANNDEDVDYVVQIEPENYDPIYPETINWPILDEVAGTVTFQYRAFVSPETDCVKVDTWNYFVQKQSASIADDLLITVPPGAQLLLPGATVSKCTDFIAIEGENLLKTNPSLNCSAGNEVIFSFTYTDNVVLGFSNESRVVTKSGCTANYILGPSGDALPFHAKQSHSFPLGGSVDVVFTPYSPGGEDLVEKVEIDGIPITTKEDKAWICTPAPVGSSVGGYVVDVPGFGRMNCIEPEQAGLQKQGCVVDANPRTYLFGGDVYTGR